MRASQPDLVLALKDSIISRRKPMQANVPLFPPKLFPLVAIGLFF